MAEGSTTHSRPLAAALASAAAAGGLAPSVHNTQPWRWRVAVDRLDLYADRSRQLTVADPEGRLLLMSCGSALHHARLALAVEGWHADVTRFPDPAEPDHLAFVTASERVPVTPEAMRLFQAAEIRHTDRRTVIDTPVSVDAIEALRAAAEGEGEHLHILRPEQVGELASATARADQIGLTDPAQRAETAAWVGRGRDGHLGVPDEAIPGWAPQAGVPLRDFGHAGALDPGRGHDRAASYGILFGPGDEPVHWLHAGEALSALWLTAVEHGVSLLPFSAVIEVTATREQIRRMLSGIGQPHLVVRLGMADPDHPGPGHTDRLPPRQVVEILRSDEPDAGHA